MNDVVLHILDWFFFIFHAAFTLFNIGGWIWKKTRRIHLITLGLTLFSWVVLGFWYGFGFCFCTQWHWNILKKLGSYPPERSYIQYLIRRLSGHSFSMEIIEPVTIITMILIILGAVVMNVREWYLKRKKSH